MSDLREAKATILLTVRPRHGAFIIMCSRCGSTNANLSDTYRDGEYGSRIKCPDCGEKVDF